VNEQPSQVIAPDLVLMLPIVDLRALPPNQREAEAQRQATEEAQQPFELAKGPLLRVKLLRLFTEEHLLLLNLHQIIFDGWSLDVFMRELAALYEAFSTGEPSLLPELSIQYADFAVWQRQWLHGEVAKAQVDYWNCQLGGSLPALYLPTDHPRSLVQTYRSAYEILELPKDLSDALKSLSQQSGTTLFMTLLAALQTLLHRYTSQEDVIVGTPIANRSWAEAEKLIGCFVNTLVLNTDVSGDPSFRDLLDRVRKVVLEAYTYQDLPFEKLIEDLQLERDLSYTPPFQVMFVLQNTPIQILKLSSLTLSRIEFPNVTGKFDLQIYLWETPAGIRGYFAYNADLFATSTITRMMGHFQTLLGSIIADPNQSLSVLLLLTEAERHQLLLEWNNTRIHYPSDVCLHQIVEDQVEISPEAVAIIFKDEQLTYRELNIRANQLAHYLLSLGVGPDIPVGICMDFCLDWAVGILGIFKAGGALVPLEPSYPKERLAYIVNDAQVPVLLTQEQFAGELSRQDAHIVCLDTSWEVITSESTENPVSGVVAENLAYVVYTSGSTGKPKGVMLSHSCACSREFKEDPVRSCEFLGRTTFRITAQDIMLLKSSGSAREFFWPLFVGAKAVIVQPDGHRDSDYLVKLIAEQKITVVSIVPSMLKAFLEEPHIEACISLRHVLCSGEALPIEIQECFFRHLTASLHNIYGITEANYTATWDCKRGSNQQVVPIGRPTDAQIYLLDRHLQPVPIGVTGEVCISGVNLSRGYFNRPDLTAETFIPNPFSDKLGTRLYKTGDLARYLLDGNIEYLGRIDHQVKIRGLRVELGEVEAILAQHPKVRETAVVDREDQLGNKHLVVYLIPNQVPDPTPSELRRFLKRKLPDHMVPTSFTILETLPLTYNGKIDRRALPSPDSVKNGLEDSFVAPRGTQELQLTQIWEAVLDVHPIGVQDNFFDLGGHSLLAVRLMARIREAFKVELPLSSLFEHSTVVDLSTTIAKYQMNQSGEGKFETSLPIIVPAPDQKHLPFPLTDIQQAYWFGQGNFFELGNVAAYSYAEYEFAELDIERLNLAWQKLVNRHGMLRVVVLPDGQQQMLEQVPPYQIKVSDLRGKEPQAIALELERTRQRMSNQVLRTDQWPLFELCASHLDNCIRLHVSIHLLIADGLSLKILMQEWAHLYQEATTPLPFLDLSFRDYVLAEMATQNAEPYQRSLNYWKNRIHSLPAAPDLPLAKHPTSLTNPHFVRRRGILESEPWLRLQARTTQAGLTPTAVLCSVYAEVLATWSKSSRFTINILLLNRLPLHPQVNKVVGNFSTTALLELDCSTQDCFKSRAKRLSKQLWNDIEHSYVSGIQVLQELNRAKGVTSKAAMPVVFTSALNLFLEGGESSDLPWQNTKIYSCLETPQVWIDHQVSEEGGTLVFNWDTVDELFPVGLIDDMFEAYCRLLHRLAEEEEIWKEIGRLQLIPPSQCEQRKAVHAPDSPVSGEMLHTLFVSQVSQRPQQLAVVSSRKNLTYTKLYHWSNQVAHWLRQRGAYPNTLVAVVMEKGWEQVVAVMGILQSGAAYLPIDPELPKERFHYLLKHGEVKLALTQSWLDKHLEWPEAIQRFQVDSEQLRELNEQPLESMQSPEDLAYVIFTSGSTGLPKGVMINHRGAVNTIIDINRRFGLNPGDRILALSSLSFDLSVYDIFGILAAGGTIVMPPAISTRDPVCWIELMQQEQVTIWNSAPALMEMLVESLTDQPRCLLDSLRLTLLSGDWIPVTLPHRIQTVAKNAQVVSLGGATEASIWSIYYPIEDVDPNWKSIPYGRPLTNQRFYVLNDMLEPCPVWVTGNLYIAGIGLATGYWRDQEKTSASFVTHPRTGEQLYRTGDLGRYLPNGNIEFLGREDFQVKIRGYRIELEEIEATLIEHPAIQAAVVTALVETQGDKRLVAYIVFEQGKELTNNELQNLLANKLPTYMIPSNFIILDSLPLTFNGKVDRRSLPIPSRDRAEIQKGYVAPRDTIELQLTQIWQDILDLPLIGVTDNFFDLGGQSFSVVRMMTQIQKQFNRELPLSTILQESTIERLAEILRQQSDVSAYSPMVKIQSGDTEKPFFCVHPAGGNVLCYVDLARRLGSDQLFYGLQSVGLNGKQEPLTSIEDMATHYVKALRNVQPKGPYFLGGWSLGGVIAFEMAHQLRQQDCEIALLVLLDSPAPSSTPELNDDDLIAWFIRDLGGRFAKDLPVSYDRLYQFKPEEQLQYILEQAHKINVLLPDTELLQIQRLLQVFKFNMQALRNYVGRSNCPSHIVLFRASDVPFEDFSNTFSKDFLDPSLGWDKFATKPVEVHHIQGDHYTMFVKPNVQFLAERLKACIDEAKQEG